MTNEEAKHWIEICVQDYIRNYDDYTEEILEARDMMFEALEAQPCIEDYPTCTECEHYDSEKHYCPRFCQVIKDTLAEAQPCEEQQTDNECANIIAVRNYLWSRIDLLRDEFGDDEYFDMFWEIARDIYNDVPHVVPKLNVDDIHREREQAYMLGYEDASKKFRTEPSEDCISSKQALDDKGLAVFHRYDDYVKMRNYLKTLPSVTPQRQKGKWIGYTHHAYHGTDDMGEPIWRDVIVYHCSECKRRTVIKENDCPNCGAEMSGGGEDEVSD